MKILRLTLALLALASPALAADKWVSPTGTAAWSAATFAGNPASLATANANAAAGDRVHMLPGTYGAAIAPVNSGTSGSRIVFMGAAGDSSSVIVTGITMHKRDYTTVKWLRCNGSANFNTRVIPIDNNDACSYDSLYFCVVTGSFDYTGSIHLTVANCRIGIGNTNSGGFTATRIYDDGALDSYTYYTKVYDTRVYTGGDNAPLKMNRVFWADFQRSSFQMYYTGTGGSVPMEWNMVCSGAFTDCRWELNNAGTQVNAYAFYLRDSCSWNVFTRDTMQYSPGSGTINIRLSGSGALNPPMAQYNNHYIGCVIKSNGVLSLQGFARRNRFEYCKIITSSGLTVDHAWVKSDNSVDSLTFVHNTVYNTGTGKCIWFDNTATFGAYLSAGSTVSHNIFAVAGNVSGQVNFIPDNPSSSPNGVVSYNLYWTGDPAADSSSSSCLDYLDTAGGTSNVGSGSAACSALTWECQSRFGDPLFANAASGDFTPSVSGNAAGAWWPDGYVGAINPAGADVTPPGAVGDLSLNCATTTQLCLVWTAAGDDSFSVSYPSYTVVKRASSAITSDSLWNVATTVTTLSGSDLVSGGSQQPYVVTGLTPSTTYYFAVRSTDEAGNSGDISNSPSGTTESAGDTTRPDEIANLVASSPWNGFVRLAWTAVGDDSLSGTAYRYDVRYRLGEALTTTTWDDTVHTETAVVQGRTYFWRYPAAEPPAPSVAGSSESYEWPFTPGQTVYFAMKVYDDNGNLSGLSNSDSTRVRIGADTLGMEWPRRFTYGGAGPTQPSSGARISKAWPMIHYDSLTINTTELDRLARADIVAINPDAAAFDSIVAVVRYLRSVNRGIKILVEPATDAAYMQTDPDTAINDAQLDGWRLYYWQTWRTLRNIKPWPSSFTVPYQSTYGIPQGNGATADTIAPSPWVFVRAPGRKNAMLGTLTGACPCGPDFTKANAGQTLRNVNMAYRNSAGRYVVAESLAVLHARLFYDRTYTEYDGVTTRRLFDGIFQDLHSFGMAMTAGSYGDSADWARGAESPWGYANGLDFIQGWKVGATVYDLKLRKETPEWVWYGANAGTGEGYAASGGYMREGWPAQQGGSWGTNAYWQPGGGFYDDLRYVQRPQLNTLFMSPSQQTQGDSSVVSGFSPDTTFARQDYRYGMGSATLWDAAFNYGPSKASMAHGQGLSAGAYYSWVFDEQRTDGTTGQSLGASYPDSSGWLGQPLGNAYAHYPGASGALFTEDFKNGSAADSAQWATLQKNADGLVTTRPTTHAGSASVGGYSFYLEMRAVRTYPSSVDYLVGALADNARFRVDNGGVYTVSGWAKADSSRTLNLWFRDSLGATAKAGNENAKRIVVGTTWAPFSMTITATVSTARRVALALAIGDTLGVVRVTGLQVHPGDSTMWVREFTRGLVVVNPTSASKSHTFGRWTRRLLARSGVWANINNGEWSRTVTVPATDAVFLQWVQDSLRPGPLQSFAVSCPCRTASITFNETGDDSTTGSPTRYEVRSSPNPISTEDDWSKATLVASDAVGVQAFGTSRQYSSPNLARATTYYFAARAYDDGNLAGAISSASVTSGNCRGRRRWR